MDTEARKKAGSCSRSYSKSALSPERRAGPLFVRRRVGLLNAGRTRRGGHGALDGEVEHDEPAEDEDTCRGERASVSLEFGGRQGPGWLGWRLPRGEIVKGPELMGNLGKSETYS